MAYNNIQIKRRLEGASGAPGSLLNGELAYNEVDDTLYYGASGGVIREIAGSGAFATLDTAQTISGSKTFSGSTTLSSTTFSANSVIDAGNNTITNLATPTSEGDAATKGYVDTEIDSLSGALQSAIDGLDSSATTAIEALSTEVYNTFVEKTENEAVTLNGGLTVTNGLGTDSLTTTGDATIGQNLTVTGNLSVLGTQVVVNTETINISGTSTQIDIVNNGTGTGLTVHQTGSQDVAEFKDDNATALIIKDGGNVGIGTADPNKKLTVVGDVSATGTITGAGGLEISSGGGSTSLYVTDGKVGINTETPNEALTISGNVSATGDFFGDDATFTGASTLGSLSVTNATVLAGSLSAAGTVEFDSTLNVDGAATFGSTVDVTGATVLAGSLSAAGVVEFDSTLTVDGGVTMNSDLSGNGSTSTIFGFILDGGTF